MKHCLRTGEFIVTDECLVAPNKSCHLVVQKDGNLRLFAGGGSEDRGECLWSTTHEYLPEGDYFAVLQPDGDFAVHQGVPEMPQRVLWRTGTAGANGKCVIEAADGGRFTLRSDEGEPRVLWSGGRAPALRAAAVPDTTNVLTQFDMCLAVAQQAINSQLKYAWASWKRRAGFSDELKIYKTRRNGVIVDSKLGLTAKLAPLTVDLNVPDAKHAQVKVTFNLQSGTVDYYNEEVGEPDKQPIQNWSVSFLADLARKPVDLGILKTIDPQTHDEAAKSIPGLSDAVFAIEYLFLQFTNVNLVLSDNKNVRIPDNVPHAARTKALDSLNFLLQGALSEHPFLLGTVVRRKRNQAVPTFALTDFIFAVNPNPAAPAASTLAYLGAMENNPLPANLAEAAARVSSPWLTKEYIDGTGESVSGVMMLRKGMFMGRYLIPLMTAKWGTPPLEQGNTWTFAKRNRVTSGSDDIIHRDWDGGQEMKLTLTLRPGTNLIDVSGRINSWALMDGYTHIIALHTEWIHYEGHLDVKGTIALTGSGAGTAYKLTPKLEYSFGGVVVDNDTIKGGAKVLTAFQSFFKSMGMMGNTTEERLRGMMGAYINTFRACLDEVLGRINVEFTNQAFIPPGGSVFTFSNPRFTGAGDILWNAIYIAP